MATSLAIFAQTGAGAKYGARDPMTCPNAKEPAKGAPSPEQVKRYLQCHRESVSTSGGLWLLGDINVEVGKGLPYQQFDKNSRPGDADPDSPIYPIRGSLTNYQCSPNKTCTAFHEPNAKGYCYRSSFGDWVCNMSDVNTTQTRGVPPPR